MKPPCPPLNYLLNLLQVRQEYPPNTIPTDMGTGTGCPKKPVIDPCHLLLNLKQLKKEAKHIQQVAKKQQHARGISNAKF